MNDMQDDFEPVLPAQDQLAAISTIVASALKLMRDIESTEEYLKTLKSDLHVINTRTLPDVMASAGTAEFKTQEGFKVSINDFVSGSLPKEITAKAEAMRWLEAHDAGGLIKNQLRATFDKGQDNIAGEVRAVLDKFGIGFESKRDVHPQTLAAFARERMRNGEQVPLETLGLFAGRTAKITAPKGT